MLRSKGRNPMGLQIALVVLWFVGELVGAIAAVVIAAIAAGGGGDGVSPLAYLGALLGAGCAATSVFVIAHFISSRAPVDQTGGFPVQRPMAAAFNPYANAENQNR